MPAPDRISLGKSGEKAACDELTRRGYAILARRYRTRVGEIDIVARDGATLVFVEVKARTTARYGHPAEAVTLHKQAKITAMAVDYLSRNCPRADQACRFDVVAVHLGERGDVTAVEVIQNAFEAVGWH
jgi:putative endonuclease